MGRPRTVRLSYEKVENSTDVASSYVKGERIKKMLKAASYESKKDEVVVKLANVVMSLEHACYHVDLLSRAYTAKAYDIVCIGGVSSLNFSKLKN